MVPGWRPGRFTRQYVLQAKLEWTLKLTISYSHALGVSQKVIQYIPSLAHQHHFIACAHD